MRLSSSKKIVLFLLAGVFLSSFVSVTHAQSTAPGTPGSVSAGATGAINTVSSPVAGVAGIVEKGNELNCGVISGSFVDCILIGITYVVYGTIYFIGYVGHLGLLLGAAIFSFTLKLNAQILDNNSSLALDGFRIMLSIANLGFVLVLIIIAIATILRFRNYDAKKLLLRLVVVAVAINFGLLLIGAFLQISNTLANAFFTYASQPSSGAAGSANAGNVVNPIEGLANLLAPQNYVNFSNGNLGSGTNFWEGLFIRASGMGAMAVLTWLIAITILGVAFGLLYRFVILTILIITLPIAWLAAILPKWEKYFNEWRDKFIGQITFLPVIAFAIYLVTRFSDRIKTVATGINGIQNIEQGLKDGGFLYTTLPTILQVFVVIGLLWAGLIAATKSGEAAATFATGALTGLRKRFVSAGKQIPKTLSRPAARRAAGYGARLASLPYIRRLGGNRLSTKLGGVGKKQVEDYQKENLSGLSGQQLEAALAGTSMTDLRRAALLAETAKRDKTSDLTKHLDDKLKDKNLSVKERTSLTEERDRLLDSYIATAKRMNPNARTNEIPEIKKILENRPELAPKVLKEDLSDAIRDAKSENQNISDQQAEAIGRSKLIGKQVKKIRGENLVKLNKEAYKDPDIALALEDNQLRTIIRDGSDEIKNTLEETLKKALTVKGGDAGKGLADISEKLAKALAEHKEEKSINPKSNEAKLLQKVVEDLRREKKIKYDAADDETKKAFGKLHTLHVRVGGSD